MIGILRKLLWLVFGRELSLLECVVVVIAILGMLVYLSAGMVHT